MAEGISNRDFVLAPVLQGLEIICPFRVNPLYHFGIHTPYQIQPKWEHRWAPALDSLCCHS
jgi:hypothetical protein